MRRGIRVVFLAATILAVAACVSAGLRFPSAKIYPSDTDTKNIHGLLFKPDNPGPSSPAVVLLHHCGGMTGLVTEDWPSYLSSLGYVVLTIDSYGSRGVQRCTRKNYFQTRTNMVKDAYGALEALAKLPYVDGNRVAVIGFSEGANAINQRIIAFELDRKEELQFKAAISFYGRCNNMLSYSKDDMPLLQIIPELDVQRASTCIMAGKRTDMEYLLLMGAYHSFDDIRSSGRIDSWGNQMLYDTAATDKAREATKIFLARHLKK
ncbi:MAG: prolyl oligopeptidase family serine peptidase [Rhodospirillaceae bacterium]|jgi:dienelactone hydrolase|nr:prolyl oligopeptidase family serine peptidase [Rhodospirillaceae bacterium]MBT4689440.1 prolyl oligopeptidase family serine peptidase [Rhodospirillaceae bacterium]MBT5079160.1 prolyl oligopeptidase family serine peptidase [Rhodospirillaceae bacterium]MBT5527474.1 prolyl oligopeptidase family serine peptidase [Rhodospirillaceae bacterium]MBT5878697.1 prolyl oligopeptidase family serine peptidase [Rhodospirillaceae bacterium]